MAVGAQVPVALVRFDWGRRTLSFVDFVDLTGDVEADYARMAQVFVGVQGCRPELAGPVRPMPKTDTTSEKK